MWETHQASGAARWPVWAGWRMGVTQGLMPAIAIALGTAGVLRAARRGLWLPALWPIASALAQRPPADVVIVHVPRGYDLFVPGDVAVRLRALEPFEHGGPVLFAPNGTAGCTDTASRK